MKRMIILVVVAVLAAGSLFAHGKEQHVMGTVTAMTDSSITVKTTAKDPVTVYTMAETKYEKDGAAASMKDLKVGDRVVIRAAKMGDKLMANEVRFGAMPKTP
jgi:cell division protein FtsL